MFPYDKHTCRRSILDLGSSAAWGKGRLVGRGRRKRRKEEAGKEDGGERRRRGCSVGGFRLVVWQREEAT